MIKKSKTYRFFLKVVTTLLVIGFFMPTSLQAKSLVDFCMMEMANHHQNMDDSHDCCHSKTEHHSNSLKNHNCENSTICACLLDEASAREPATTPNFGSSDVTLTQTGFNFMLVSPDEIVHKDLFVNSNSDAPPLYLLYDTFLN